MNIWAMPRKYVLIPCVDMSHIGLLHVDCLLCTCCQYTNIVISHFCYTWIEIYQKIHEDYVIKYNE